MVEHRSIRVRGRVQGVRFRVSAQGEADRFGLHGYVRNESDGTVYIEIEGESDAIDAFVVWCRKGPMFAHVTHVDVQGGQVCDMRDFEVR